MGSGEHLAQNPNRVLALLESLRKILIQSGIVILLFSIGGYFFSLRILVFLQARTGVQLAAFGVPETFIAVLTLSLATGLIAGVPFIFYRILSEVALLFSSFSRRMMLAFWVSSMVLFIGGAVFCLGVTLPYGVRFLLNFQTPYLEAVISVKKFVSFCFLFVFGFGCIFELPLAMILLARLGLVEAKVLARHRRYAILGISVVSAILTPTPDIFNLSLMGVPLYLLYEIGLIGMRICGNRKSRHRFNDRLHGLVG
ncbi:MAG: twin-arginine translocase subunit TatC [Desulfobacterales bacterium]|nr:MAG: twin-arginine translocase subunit TatC [Desulfobacterales bacterium]